MITLLSPAKKLANEVRCEPQSNPVFASHANELIDILQELNPDDLAKLMSLSDKLALLNYERYQDFANYSGDKALAAAYLFQGDVYQGLDFASLDAKSVKFSQEHLGILSGLYGLLSPLDGIAPYRLEMGTSLENGKGKNLYAFWLDLIAVELNRRLKSHKSKEIINLASQEYFKAVDKKQLVYPVIDIDFKELKDGKYKTIGIHAKKARGTMARFILINQIDDYESLLSFDQLGYALNDSLSSEMNLVFTR
jgi:cytoplasmic iron level regulating protein YaaA (DUF328/UPF0246 family)